MKRTLLSSFALFFSMWIQAQTAFNAPGVYRCDQSPADLSTQTPFVLGNQLPAEFTVTYHVSESDATNNSNPIAGVLAYSGIQIREVYARLTNNTSGTFATSGFKVVWDLPSLHIDFEDIVSCQMGVLHYAAVGAFYTQPNGMGYPMQPNSLLIPNNSGIYYYYAGNAECFIESSFYVYIDDLPHVSMPTLTNCIGDDIFDLTQATSYNPSFHQTEEDAWNHTNAITDPTAYQGTYGEVVYASMQDNLCANVESVLLSFEACTPNTIFGKVGLSQNAVNCSDGDPGFQGCRLTRTFEGETRFAYTNNEGHYLFSNVPTGINTVAPAATQPYISILNFTSATMNVYPNAQLTANFCVNENPYTDVKTQLWSLGTFRPAITTQVKLLISNPGNTAVSGIAQLVYDETKINFISATEVTSAVNPGILSFMYTLGAHQSQGITIHFFTPTTTVMDDVLAFSSNSMVAGDQAPENNHATLQQIVVNSYDPNDITILEGPSISVEQAQDYLHYVVRFQNTGTAEALNIRIENELSDLLDASTFRPLYASHIYFTERVGDQVTFRFPNIDLAAQQDDEPASHGYVVYEVKPVAGIAVGDVIDSQASIFFDTNPAIVTNTSSTTVAQLSIGQNVKNAFVLHPNPANSAVRITAAKTGKIDMDIIDVRGVNVLSRELDFTGADVAVDISGLASGVYFVMLSEGIAVTVKKLLVH